MALGQESLWDSQLVPALLTAGLPTLTLSRATEPNVDPENPSETPAFLFHFHIHLAVASRQGPLA